MELQIHGSFEVPIWLMLLCSATMTLGTSIGGYKIIKTVGLKYEDFNLTCSYREQLQQKNDQIQSDNYDLIKLGKGAECKELIPYNVKEAEEYVMEQEKKIFDELSFISYDVCQKYIFFTLF